MFLLQPITHEKTRMSHESGQKTPMRRKSRCEMYPSKNVRQFARESKAKKKEKRIALFPEIGWTKIFLSLTRQHSRMCIRIHLLKGTVMQIEKALINDRLRVSKVF